MKNSIIALLFSSIILIINILCSYGVTLEESQNIELAVSAFFKKEKESCKNEYRQILRLRLDDNKDLQKYLETVKPTSCNTRGPGYETLNRELYEVYRDYPRDVFGNLCKETEIQANFDKYNVCDNICYVKLANFYHIYRYRFKTSRLERNQMDLMNKCAKVLKK